MEKKIPKLTVQLLTAIAVTLALVMIVEELFLNPSFGHFAGLVYLHSEHYFGSYCGSSLGSCL